MSILYVNPYRIPKVILVTLISLIFVFHIDELLLTKRKTYTHFRGSVYCFQGLNSCQGHILTSFTQKQ